ncbi:glycerol-3-phosphate 1-O-acyltransferase PlsY [Chitinimonas koreensis]|uniref:glycerol-3-phosphate 1-O-acyltransferase PlsY n=1 Tax=Chitinimonas koreensis TaxID=356302 RepID=UPI0003F8D262|nr:glycerol-3-phosphate 1-O-acyltransferase PlsY [Chitinimonas koreensis]QNM95205.1 glycerol-3-phosphate 1-O-acyltransferase PlsY [Chitinimonas koreensis]
MPSYTLPLALTIAAYLVGSLSFAVIVSRALKMADPRSYGSGNPGATNVLRSGKKKAAVMTLLGDTLKGVLIVALARLAGLDDVWLAAVALAVVVGHMWPLFFGFKGGKGVATAAGVLFVLDWRLGLAVLAAWLLVAAATRISSLAAILAAVAAPIACHLLNPDRPALFGAVLAIAALLIQRHKRNLVNLLSGREGKIGERAGKQPQE